MNDKPLLMLPAPDYSRWIFYRKRQPSPPVRDINPPKQGAYFFPSPDVTTNYDKLMREVMEQLWRDFFGPPDDTSLPL